MIAVICSLAFGVGCVWLAVLFVAVVCCSWLLHAVCYVCSVGIDTCCSLLVVAVLVVKCRSVLAVSCCFVIDGVR